MMQISFLTPMVTELLPKVHLKCYLPSVCSGAGRCGIFTSLHLMSTFQPQTPKHVVHTQHRLYHVLLCIHCLSPQLDNSYGQGQGRCLTHFISCRSKHTALHLTGIQYICRTELENLIYFLNKLFTLEPPIYKKLQRYYRISHISSFSFSFP